MAGFNTSSELVRGPRDADAETASALSEKHALLMRYQQCLNKFLDFPYVSGTTYCNATFDTYLCWPPTKAGAETRQHCPAARLSDTSSMAFRRCGPDGLWLGRRPNETSLIGWTNYTPCFPPEVQTLFNEVYDDEHDAQIKFEIAKRTRYMEIVGFSISLVALLLSLTIFVHYRSLRNSRTRIHKSLFTAMVVQVLIRLIVYIDQELVRGSVGGTNNTTLRGIDNMPYLCEGSYVLLEYAISAMFMWMFIEGLYLNNVVTTNTMSANKTSHLMYFVVGWGLPLFDTAIWVCMTAVHYHTETVKKCWYGYNFTSLYWIVQGPRVMVILINMVFLLNILRVLIVKLHQSRSTEVEKVRKAVRAALVLLPLLGITNALNMTEAPLGGSVWRFAFWSYSTHFLRSFQGFFIALTYCFLNGEVRQVISKHYSDYRAMRSEPRPRLQRGSILHYMSSSSGRNHSQGQDPKSSGMSLRNIQRSQGSPVETEIEVAAETRVGEIPQMADGNKKDSDVGSEMTDGQVPEREYVKADVQIAEKECVVADGQLADEEHVMTDENK